MRPDHLSRSCRSLLACITAFSWFMAATGTTWAQDITWTAQTSGTAETLREVWGADASNVWAVGHSGTIVKYDGTAWAPQTSGTAFNLIGVWGTDASNVWAVGSGGTILKYNGSTWAAQTSNTTAELRSVWGTDASNVWAVGGSGVIVKWNGSVWAEQTSGTTKLLFGVSGTSATNVWAVGFDGTIRRWDGSTWAAQTSNNVNSYFAIYVADANNAWAVEDNSDASYWNGTAWSTQDVGSVDQLLGVSGSSATNVRAIGTSGTVRKYDGTSWSADTTLPIDVLHGIWAASATQWWIVGENGSIYSGAPAAVPTASPTVTTTNPGTIGSTTVVMGGNVTADGGGPVLERGIVWGTAANPTILDNKFPIGTGLGSFSGTVTGLTPTTTVFARAFARNSLFTGYGAETSFVTLSNNADLSALTTTAGALSPGFAANTTSYTASVPNATTSVTVTPTVAQATATVTVNSVPVTSGSPSGSIALNVGSNTLTTVVTAQDGTTTKTYTLTVTRAAPVLAGDPITPTDVLTTSQWVGPIAGVKENIINGTGLSGGGSVLTQTHDELVTANTMWHAGPDAGGISGGETGPPPFGAPLVNTQAVEFDLGANYDLSAAHIWNMNQAGNIGRGVKDVQILISSATTGAFTALTTTQFTQGTGAAGLAAQVVPLTGATNVRRVRFSIQTAWSGATSDYVGLSEVRFQGTPYAGPNAAPVLASTAPFAATESFNLAENTAVAIAVIGVTDADSGQTHTWALSGADAGMFQLIARTSPAGTYQLAFKTGSTPDFETKTDANGDGIYEVIVTATDSGTPAASDSVALSITITDDNDAPTVSAIADQSTNEDTPKTIAFTVADQDAGQSLDALVVTATVHVDDTALIPQTAENIVLGGSGASRTLTLTPAADLSGTAEITVSVTDGQAEHHTTSRTFILTVNAVNDAPSFTLPVNITRFPGSGAYTQADVVSAISPGPADESGQTVTFSLLPGFTNPTLFTVPPTLAANGSLSFTPGSAPGVSTLTVRAQDDGGTANGGVNFTEHTFTIAISVLNSRPAGEVWTARDSNRIWLSITSSADGSKLAAVAFDGHIYTSSDSGVTWTPRESDRDWQSITSSADGSKLAAVVDDGQIYTSSDSGVTWTPRETNRSWKSITSSADGSKLAAVGQDDRIHTSTDSGVTWTARESNRKWYSITSSADGSKLAAVVLGGQIYTSTDSGVTWTARMTDANRPWQSITSSADGSKLAAVVGGLIPGQIYTSTDSGVTWTARESNRKWLSITSSADGSKLAAVVGGLIPGQIYTSTDSGVTWTARESNRIWLSITSSADGSKLAAVTADGQIYTSEGSSLPDVAAGRAFTQANFTSADTSSNIVSYQVTNNNPALFAVQPAIAANGTLTFTAGQNVGTATVTVTATYNGGADTSSATFTVNVTKPLKVVESFFVVTNEVPAEQDRLIAVGETFVGIFFGSFYIDNAPSDLPPLVLSGPDAAAFDLNPTIGLEFKTVPVFPNPRPGSLGVYDVTLSIGAATSPLGIAKARLRITSNKAPTLAAIADPAELAMNAPQQTVNLSGISAGAGETQALTVTATSSNTALIPHPSITYSSPATTGALSFTPVANAAGTAVISVTVNDGQAANNRTTQTFTITVTPPPTPTLTSVAPAIGSTLGGTPVTLTGTNFAGPASVTFGGTAATSVTVVSPTTITATTPARAAGAVSVVVTTPGGTNAPNTLYTYAANSAPVLGAPTASNVTSSRVTLLGTVTYDGGAAVTEQGFIYAPITRSPTPVIGGPGVVQRPSALVAQGLSASESGLQPGTSYALRSYARNSFGLSYSGVTTNFQTGPLLGRLEIRTDDNSVLADNDGYGFGNAATGATKVRTLTVRNVGTTRLINIVAAITGANAASFTRTLPSTTLEPGASMNVALSFLPAALGTATATVAFSSSETSQPPLRVNLSGNGVTPGAAALSVKVGDTQITDNVGSVDYGNVPLSTSAERVFTLTNTGADNLTGLVLSVIGTHKTDVTLSPLTATVLSAGDSVSFTAYLTPGVVGARSATIQIKSNDTTAQPFFDIPVTATGIVPEIDVKQGTLAIVDNSTVVSFGTTVPVGTDSVRTFTVKNLGTSTLTLGAISFDGLHAADFTATVPASLSLAQNASTTFDVTFRPSSGGARTAALHLLTSDANESPFDIKLSGTGIGPEISVAAGTVQLTSGGPAIDFGEVITATSSAARTYTLKNLGNAPLTGISVSSDSPRFVVGGTTATSLLAGKSTTFTLTFSPDADGPFTGTISIVSNDFDEATFTLPVKGKGAANTPPTINPGPQDQIIALGQPVTFTATVTSPLSFTRQWRRGTANISGATAETYSINEVKLADAQKYQLRATNTAGTKQSADSTAAALTVVDRTATSQNLQITKVATFTITAASAPGSTLTYLWKKDGGPLPANATASGKNLSLTNLELANAGTYTCDVTGPGGTMTGGDQVLTVFDSQPVISSTPAPSPSLSLKAFAAAAPSAITLTLPDAFLEGYYTYQVPLVDTSRGNASEYKGTGLPPGLAFDTKTGRLSGIPMKAGSYSVTFTAKNAIGSSSATGTLTVNPNLGNSVAGSYLGLIERGPLTGGLGGHLDLTISIPRAFTGKLTLGSSPISFVGSLNNGDLNTSITIPRTGLPNLTLAINIDLANNRFATSGCTLTDGTNTSAFSGWRQIWSTTNAPTTYLGAYNFAMSAPTGSPADTIPLGYGYGTLSVQAKGALTTVGRLPDGDSFVINSLLGPNGEVALFSVLPSKSSLHGNTQINPGATNAANTLANGSLTWTRPATRIGATTKTTLYAAGFGPIALTCEGGRYTAPVAPGLLMGKAPGIGNAKLRFYDANIGSPPSPADCAVTLTTTKATVVTPSFTKITITGTTGSFTGSFALTNNHPFLSGAPVIKRNVTFNGLIIPTASGLRGYGYFLLPQLPVNVFPAPPTPSLSGGVELE